MTFPEALKQLDKMIKKETKLKATAHQGLDTSEWIRRAERLQAFKECRELFGGVDKD